MRPDDPCWPDDRQAGVTLIEMLVVLGLMALIGVFVAGGFAAIKGALPLTGVMANADEIGLTRDHLRRTVSEAMAQSILRQSVYFEGDQNAVSFVAAADPLFEAPGLVRVLLRGEMVNGRLALVERRRIDREEVTPETGSAVLLRNIAGVSFRYMRGGKPVAAIRKGDPLPDRMIVDIAFPAGDTRQFPPLDIPLVCGVAPGA